MPIAGGTLGTKLAFARFARAVIRISDYLVLRKLKSHFVCIMNHFYLFVINTSKSNGQIIGFPFAERKIKPAIFRIRLDIFWAFGRIICMS